MGLAVRLLIVVVGLAFMLAGLISIPLPGVGLVGLWWIVVGGALVLAVALERQRYRSTAAELGNAPAGPGGGETPESPLEPRFHPTAEVFVDPTTGHRMRVLADPSTGERRYVAEA